jgi:protein TonB
VHAGLVMLVLLLLAANAARPVLTPIARKAPSMRMPVMAAMPAAVSPPPPRGSVERASPPAAPLHPAPPVIEARAAAAIETPLAVEAEPAVRDDEKREDEAAGAGVEGAPNGVDGGLVGGTGRAPAVDPPTPAPAAAGPYRLSDGIERPRKSRDVKPVYPLAAMAANVGGNVFIEATIGADGKVHHARVIRSVAILEQAALEAVRQWEYEPARFNGVAVAVTMVIVVTFAIL